MLGYVRILCVLAVSSLIAVSAAAQPSAHHEEPHGLPDVVRRQAWSLAKPPPALPVLLVPESTTLTLAEFGAEIDRADITDVEVADFDGDGRNDVAAAWFATDLDDMSNNQRFLTFFFGCEPDAFVRGPDLDLYIPNYVIEALSVFRNGSSDIGVGDFDGDGDPDLAVTAFHGDELWFIENLGGGAFAQHLKFPYGFNSTGNLQTPPEALAADFDDDGRDELVYIPDPVFPVDPYLLHFWKTDDTVANMRRVYWNGVEGGAAVQWARGLALGDFDGDGRPDACFSASVNPPYEDDPVLVFWYDLNPAASEFVVHLEYPSFLCSDIVALRAEPALPAGVLVTDLDGTEMEFWAHAGGETMAFYRAAAEDGYAGLAPDRGMAAALGDVDGDGDLDLLTRQKLGSLNDTDQVEVTLSANDGHQWNRVDPVPLNTYGFQDQPYTTMLRPHNVAVADLFGNTLPEVVAAFGPSPTDDPGERILRVAYWANSCLGDVTRDGLTDLVDLTEMLFEMQEPRDRFNPDADLNKDGQVDLADLNILLADYGCDCAESGRPAALPLAH
jgi:hypothetical protein